MSRVYWTTTEYLNLVSVDTYFTYPPKLNSRQPGAVQHSPYPVRASTLQGKDVPLMCKIQQWVLLRAFMAADAVRAIDVKCEDVANRI